MTTQTEISKSHQTIHLPLVNKISLWPLGLVIILSLILLVAANTFMIPQTSASTMNNRALQAWSARYQGLADAYPSDK